MANPTHRHPLLEALKVARASKNGVPMQIQSLVQEIVDSEDPASRTQKANEISRWLYAEQQKPGVDQFTKMSYNALLNALSGYIPSD